MFLKVSTLEGHVENISREASETNAKVDSVDSSVRGGAAVLLQNYSTVAQFLPLTLTVQW